MSERRVCLTKQPLLEPITLWTASHTVHTHTHRHARCGIDSFFVDRDMSLTSTCTDLSGGLVSHQTESTRQWYASPTLHLPPHSFHVNYSRCLSGFLWVWQEREAALLKHLQKFITLHLMNLVDNWQGAAKKCELSVGITLHTRETQHTHQLSHFTTRYLYSD